MGNNHVGKKGKYPQRLVNTFLRKFLGIYFLRKLNTQAA